MKQKRNFWEIAQWLQITAQTAEEAEERIDNTCSLCKYAYDCHEERCPAMRAHKTRLISLEAEADQQATNKVRIVHTRAYKKATPEVKMKKTLLSYLTKLSKICTSRSKQLLLDDASVMVELGEYTMAYWILKNGKLIKTAERVMEIIKRYKEA